MTVPSLSSNDSQANVIANYASENNQSVPFVITKKVGDGEILYFNVRPLFETLYSGNDTERLIFQKLGDLLPLANLNASGFEEVAPDMRWKYMLYDTTWIRGYAELEGSVSMESNSTVIPYDRFGVGRLELINATGEVNGSSVQNTSIYPGIDIKNFSINGPASSIASSNELYLFPTNYGAYGGVLLGLGSNVSLQLGKNSACSFTIASGNNTYGVNLDSGTIIMENITASESDILPDTIMPKDVTIGEKMLMFARTPTFSVEGATFLSEAHIPNYIKSVTGYPVLINGTTTFNFDCASDNETLLTDFAYSGVLQTEQEPTEQSMLYWELEAIPWESILTSPLFVVPCIILALIVIIAYVTILDRKTQQTARAQSKAEAEEPTENPDYYW